MRGDGALRDARRRGDAGVPRHLQAREVTAEFPGFALLCYAQKDKADKIKVDLALSKANASDFDSVLLPGGVINGDALRIEKKAQQFVQEIDRAGKPIFVICHGSWLLVSAGLVKRTRHDELGPRSQLGEQSQAR
jgi:putative intracellular protease/amidase